VVEKKRVKFHLILMRHAKSDWSRPGVADHERPLNMRGRSDAPAMARWLSEQDMIPDAILCSSAVRTVETGHLLNATWKLAVDLHTSDALYLASAEQLFEVISSEGPAWASQRPITKLMVLARNPGISDAASILSDGSVELPTAGAVIFHCDIADWTTRLHSGKVQLVSQMRPKLLDRTIA